MQGSLVIISLIFISSLPVIAVYIWFRLAKYKLSIVQFLLALLTGAAAFFPALIFQNAFRFSSIDSGRWALFFHVFIRIAFSEELSRLLMLIIFFWVSTKFDPKARGINQPLSFNSVVKGSAVGLVAGLGFAVLESAVYGASNTRILLLRAVTAAPLHGACGSRVGSAAVMLRTNPFQAIFRLLAATAIHGIYNFMVSMPGFPSVAAICIAISALASTVVTIRNGWNIDENSLENS
jgi:RsiW-degrading membrane proteinase PrsW (M82 family)